MKYAVTSSECEVIGGVIPLLHLMHFTLCAMAEAALLDPINIHQTWMLSDILVVCVQSSHNISLRSWVGLLSGTDHHL